MKIHATMHGRQQGCSNVQGGMGSHSSSHVQARRAEVQQQRAPVDWIMEHVDRMECPRRNLSTPLRQKVWPKKP